MCLSRNMSWRRSHASARNLHGRVRHLAARVHGEEGRGLIRLAHLEVLHELDIHLREGRDGEDLAGPAGLAPEFETHLFAAQEPRRPEGEGAGDVGERRESRKRHRRAVRARTCGKALRVQSAAKNRYWRCQHDVACALPHSRQSGLTARREVIAPLLRPISSPLACGTAFPRWVRRDDGSCSSRQFFVVAQGNFSQSTP